MLPKTEAELDLLLENQRQAILMEKSLLPTNLSKQMMIYLISFLLPPFGLKWGIKYLRSDDEKARKIGLVSVILTIVSLIINFIIIKDFVSGFSQILNGGMDLYGL